MPRMTFHRAVFASTLSTVTVLASASATIAASASVERACMADYFSYCSQHDPDSAATRSCMRSNGHRLSQRCVNALVAAGEVPKAELERKTARR